MEEPLDFSADQKGGQREWHLTDPDFIGAEAALKRASAKAIAAARAAGLEPVIRPTPKDYEEGEG